jgi:hypothetical protein
MLSIISKFDGLLQKIVDSSAFFVMRRFGWRKAYLRYCLAAVSCASLGGIVMATVRTNGFGGNAIFLTLILAWMMAITHLNYRGDNLDEDKKAILYPADVRRLPTLPFFKGLWFALLFIDIFVAVYGPLLDGKLDGGMFKFKCACDLGWDISMIIEAYLVKTPRIPPPLEEKKAVLVPAYATSRR